MSEAIKQKRDRFNHCHLCGRTKNHCFRFPKNDSEREKEWLLFCGISDNDVLSVPFLCDRHFEPKFIQKNKKYTTLHGLATPTIRIESPSIPLIANEDEPRNKYFRNCCVCGPTNSHLHKFPKDEVRKKEWVDLLRINEAERKCLLLCTSHFPAESVSRTPQGKVVLKRDAKPVLVEREKTTDTGYTASSIDSPTPEFITLEQSDTAVSTIQISAATNSIGSEIDTRTNASDKMGLNQANYEKVRQSLFQLLNSKRAEAESSKIAQQSSQLNTVHVTFESNDALVEENAEITLEYELNEPSTRAEVVSSKTLQHIGELQIDTFYVTVESNNAPAEETAEIILDYEMTEPSTRVEAEISKILQHNGELDMSNISIQTTNAPAEETAETISEYELTESSTRIEAELSKSSQLNSEPDMSNITVESNNAPVEESAEIMTEFRLTGQSTSNLSGVMSTPKRHRQRSIRYLADINSPALDSPRTRRKCLCVIRTYQTTVGNKMSLLKQQNSRMKAKITNLKSLLTDMKKKNLITEDATTTLLVKFDDLLQNF